MKEKRTSLVHRRYLLISAFLLVFLVWAGFVCVPETMAQESEPTLQVRLNKDFGYALGSRIQGAFSVRVEEDPDLAQITLWIDDQQIGTDDAPPFRVAFNTSDFVAGMHSIKVVGQMNDGREVTSPPLVVEFLSAEEARSDALKIVIPILAVVLGVMAISSVVPLISRRGKQRFQLGSYGAAGGAICPRCTMPFSRHLFSFNLGFGKLERCPHCGKWAILRRASPSDLEEAEARMVEANAQGALQTENETDHLRHLIEESRYETDE